MPPEFAKLMKDANLKNPPTQITYECRLAPSGEGPRAYDWSDKPHRLVYDLCAEIERTAAARDAEIARLREALEQVAINAEQAQAMYDRNGPTWTSRETGIEYENTADHLAFANELAAFARAALEASHDAKPEGK